MHWSFVIGVWFGLNLAGILLQQVSRLIQLLDEWKTRLKAASLLEERSAAFAIKSIGYSTPFKDAVATGSQHHRRPVRKNR